MLTAAAAARTASGSFTIIFLVLFIPPLWGTIDAARRPRDIWDVTRQNKALWIILQLVLMCCGLGWAAALAYFIAVRPKLREATRNFESRPYMAPPSIRQTPLGPPPGWYPDPAGGLRWWDGS